MPTSDLASAIDRLPERAFGGADVAAEPGDEDDGFWVAGPSAPGADEAVAWFKRWTSTDNPPAILLLVGGPGNGKSYLAGKAVESLDRLDEPEPGLADRTHRYGGGGGAEVIVVNDATIPRDGQVDQGPLAQDIDQALGQGNHVLVNANRGILHEEASQARDPSSPGLRAIQWASARPGDPEGGGLPDSDDELLPDSDHELDHIKSATLQHDGGMARIVVVLMDTCSLFETRPNTEVSDDGVVVSGQAGYDVQLFMRRDREHAATTTGERVWRQFLESLPAVGGHAEEVVRANLTSLLDPGVRTGLLTILRSAEIANSRRMTYRELWGSIARCLIGDLPSRLSGGQASQHLANIAGGPGDSVLPLAGLRFHQALFGATGHPLNDEASPRRDPVSAIAWSVDPVRDARPGTRGPRDSGWATPILESMEGFTMGKSPIQYLAEHVDSGSFGAAVTPFDRELERELRQRVGDDGTSDRDVRALASWYGEYLTRLYAVANGIPGFMPEVEMWTRAWRQGRQGSGSLPNRLATALQGLVLPQRSGTNGTPLPLLASRTEAVGPHVEGPTLVALVNAGWAFQPRTEGDSVVVSLQEQGQSVVELELDFPMLREALACHGGRPGTTEFTHVASPRLERFRSALLNAAHRRQRPLAVVDEDIVYDLDLS